MEENRPNTYNKDDDGEISDSSSDNSVTSSKRYEYNRLESYPWKWPHPISKKDLAKNGFFFIDEKKCIKCRYCKGLLNCETSQEDMNLHMTSQNCVNAREKKKHINLPLTNTDNYRYETSRLVSFMQRNWIYTHVNPEDLARSGFYSTGCDDCTRCAFCRLEVREWEQGDTAAGEHRKFNPNCPFINNGRNVGNIPLGGEVESSFNEQEVLPERTNTENHTEMLVPAPPPPPPRHPEYDTLLSRLATYNMWPRSLRQRPAEMSEAGFYYTGQGDRVICFQCGGGLKDWCETDSPWIEHASWFARCPYLLAKKGNEFVSRQKQLSCQSMDPHRIDTSCFQAEVLDPVSNMDFHATQVQPPITEKKKEETTQNVENETLSAAEVMHICKVCYQKELGIVVIPCGHMATCVDCIRQLTSCPICRSQITAYLRAFIP